MIWPRHVHIVGRIQATLPADDEVTEFRSIYLAAYRKACAGVTSVESGIRFLAARRWLLLIRCGRPSTAPVPGVLISFINVRIPDMLGPVFPQPQGVTNRLGLRLQMIKRDVAGDPPTAVVRQHPQPGTVVPFGTTVRVVVAQ